MGRLSAPSETREKVCARRSRFFFHNIRMSVSLAMNIVPWLLRQAYLITRCRIRSYRRTSLQMMKGGKSLLELVPFCETVMFKFRKSAQALAVWKSGGSPEFGLAPRSEMACR